METQPSSVTQAAPAPRRPLWPVGAACLVVVYLATRLWRLGTWVFLLNDEAIELHRALLIRADISNLWLPNVESKPPFFYWLAAGMLGLVDDPVTALRLISVAAGLVTLVVLLLLTRHLLDSATALLAGLVFVLSPYGLIFDRTGFMEPFVACLAFAAFALLVGPAQGLRPEVRAILIGALLGLAFFTKQSALLFLPFPLLWTVLAWRRRESWIGLAVVYATFVAFVLYFRLAPDVRSMWSGESAAPLIYHPSYTFSLGELLAFPWRTWLANAGTLWVGLSEHLGLPVVVLAVTAVVWLAGVRRERATQAVALHLGLPLAIVCLVATGLPGRVYLLAWVVAPSSILAARAVTAIAERVRRGGSGRQTAAVAGALAAVLVAGALVDDVPLLTRPLDHLQHLREGVLVEPSLSEHRVADAAELLAEEAAKGPIVVLMDLSFGMPNDGLAVHLWGRPGILRVHAWWVTARDLPLVPERTIEVHLTNHHRTGRMTLLPVDVFARHRVFWVVNSLRYPPAFVRQRAPDAEVVARLPGPDGASLDIYRLPSPPGA